MLGKNRLLETCATLCHSLSTCTRDTWFRLCSFPQMSRLPLPRASSPDRHMSAAPKRKSEDDHEEGENRRKIPTLAHPIKPGGTFRPGRSVSANHTSAPGGPSRQPLATSVSVNQFQFQFQQSTRADSGSSLPTGKTHKPPSTSATRPVAGRVKPPSSGRTAGPQRVTAEEERYRRLQEQMAEMEAARLADAARCKAIADFINISNNSMIVAADMDEERMKGMITSGYRG
jgi:hypothetical protein